MVRSSEIPQPFLKWAGGKRQLVSEITETIPKSFWIGGARFYEPFLGGGALTLYLGNPNSTMYVPGKRLFLNDINPDLIITYTQVRDNVTQLVHRLEKLSQDLSKNAFLDLRKSIPSHEVDIAARFIYLNKTCFNGLWRVNSKGEFNVPWGKFKSPRIFNAENLHLVSKRLQSATITSLPYISALSNVRKGDLVYLDPPYIPLSTSSSFSKYAKDGFGLLDQFGLSGVISGLSDIGAFVILSNSDTPLTREVFGDRLKLKKVSVQRTISAKTSSRNRITEILGVNYDHRSRILK
jgi:DNA adenine methylase